MSQVTAGHKTESEAGVGKHGESVWRFCRRRHRSIHSISLVFLDFGYLGDLITPEERFIRNELKMADCFAVTGYTGMKRREERDSSGLFKIVVKQTWYLTPTQTIRLIWDGEKVGKGDFYTYRYTITTRITSACEPVWPSGKALGW